MKPYSCFSVPWPGRMARSTARRHVFKAPVLFLLGLLAAAQAAEPALSLDEAVRLAVADAPMIDARAQRGIAAAEEVRRAAALPDPVLSLGVQNLPVAGADAFSLVDDRMTMRRIGVTQALPSRAKRDARLGSARARQQEAQASQTAAVLDVRRAAARAWIRLWAAERERSLLAELREQARLAARAAKANLRGGQGSASDALALRAAELELENRIDDAQARVEQARAGLARWIGEAATREITEAPDVSALPQTEAELLADLDRQSSLLVWDAREASADAALAMANAEKRPDWSIGAGIARRGAGASNVVWLEVGIGLPVFGANRQDRGISARRADLQAIRAAHEDARRTQAESVRENLAQWSALGRKAARMEQALLPLNRDRSATALAAWAAGGALTDWLVAQRDEIRSRIEYAEVLADWGESWAELAYLVPAEGAP